MTMGLLGRIFGTTSSSSTHGAVDRRNSEATAAATYTLQRLPRHATAHEVQHEAEKRYGLRLTYDEAQTALTRQKRNR
jgi:hypothetical protein